MLMVMRKLTETRGWPFMILKVAIMGVVWLTLPIIGIGGFALIPIAGVILLTGLVGYIWFMWGLFGLVFEHGPGDTTKALIMLYHATPWFLIPLVLLVVVRSVYRHQALYMAWVKAGGFFAKADASFFA